MSRGSDGRGGDAYFRGGGVEGADQAVDAHTVRLGDASTAEELGRDEAGRVVVRTGDARGGVRVQAGAGEGDEGRTAVRARDGFDAVAKPVAAGVARALHGRRGSLARVRDVRQARVGAVPRAELRLLVEHGVVQGVPGGSARVAPIHERRGRRARSSARRPRR